MVHIRDKKAFWVLSVPCSALLCILLWNFLYPANTDQNISYLAELETFPEVEIYKCRETIEHYGGIKAQICLKPLEGDTAVSTAIDAVGSWEAPIVSVMLKAMSMYPSAVFLDIGSNIGMYTVMMAAAGRYVVAVDAMLNNLAYVHQSLSVGNTTQLVRLLNHPVSDKKESLFPVNDDPSNVNPGAVRLVPVELFTGESNVVGPAITSTTLLDLLNFINTDTVIVKMDVEGYECKVLHHYLTQRKAYYLPYICMEWIHIATNMGSSCPDVQGLVDALFSNNYTPYKLSFHPMDQGLPNTLAMVEKDDIMSMDVWATMDVLWAHADAPALFW